MIYPVIQKNNLDGTAVKVNSVAVSGEFCEIAEKILKTDKNGYPVEILISDDYRTAFVEELSHRCDEKYTITVTEEKTVIKTSSKRGVFRAAHTLAKLIGNGELKTGTAEDYPLFERRGYIEGFYGPPWSHEKQLSVMSLAAKYGMNTYCYAPKDDVYHRAKWREFYPQGKLNELKELFAHATENQLDFFWCVGPGLSYCYSSKEDFDILISKIKSIYDIGVKNFGLLLDDIPGDLRYEEDKITFKSTVDAHINLVNKVYNVLKSYDSGIELIVCPTQYSGNSNGDYITKFGKEIPEDVGMFWTGEEVCSRVLTVREAVEIKNNTSHRPLYWDNYPVNDCEMFMRMHLGALTGRERDLYKYSDGLISNVMEYALCSQIPLMTVADYLWNSLEYNPEKSLKNAYRELLGEKAELFAYFADNLGISCLTPYSGAIMSGRLAQIDALFESGKTQEAIEKSKEYNSIMRECLALVSDTSVPLFEELKWWVDKFAMCCDLLDCILKTRIEPTEQNKAELSKQLHDYNFNAVVLTGFKLRETAEKVLGRFSTER